MIEMAFQKGRWYKGPMKKQQPERAEQEAVKQLLAAMGAKFYVAGVTRRKGDYQGTMQTEGLPDMPLVFLPRFKKEPRVAYDPKAGSAARMYELVVIECKSPAAHKTKHGGLSAFQRECQAYCVGAGIPYVHGDCNAIIDWLIKAGYLRAHQFPHLRVPATKV